MKYVFWKKVENIPPKNTTGIYLCDFCKKYYNVLYLYRIDRQAKDQGPDIEDLVWFCGDTCLNCYVLGNN